MKLLLWNVQRKNLDLHVRQLIDEHAVDVVVLIESLQSDSEPSASVGELGSLQRVSSPDRFRVFARPHARVTPVESVTINASRTCLWEISLSQAIAPFLLVVVHGHDRVNHSNAYRQFFFARLRESIEQVELQLGHDRTIIVGDLNDNPFDPAISSLDGLHALPVTNVGGSAYRTVAGQQEPFFYNPMWKCYGREGSPFATHYYNGSDVHELFWHMIDQVVLRPSLAPGLPINPVQVLHFAGETSLLTANGLPDRRRSSDHLPVLFTLNLEMEN